MTRKDTADLLDLAIDRAPALRNAGITRVAIGDLELNLAPAEPTADDRKVDDEEEPGVLDDPTTYGRRGPGARAPGRKRDQR